AHRQQPVTPVGPTVWFQLRLAPLNTAAPPAPGPTASTATTTGGAVTVSRKLVALVAPPSLTVRVMVTVPLCPAAGVTVTVRALPAPPKTMLPTGTSVGFVVLPLRVRLPAGVSTSLTVRDNGPTPTPTLVVCAPTLEIVGALLGSAVMDAV